MTGVRGSLFNFKAQEATQLVDESASGGSGVGGRPLLAAAAHYRREATSQAEPYSLWAELKLLSAHPLLSEREILY